LLKHQLTTNFQIYICAKKEYSIFFLRKITSQWYYITSSVQFIMDYGGLEANIQGRPKGKAAQARALGPSKKKFKIKDLGPKKKIIWIIYIYIFRPLSFTQFWLV
jgi:hypothetical protein